MAQRISGERKAAYYVGRLIQLVGIILVVSFVVTFLGGFGDFPDVGTPIEFGMYRFFGGVVLVIAGGSISRIGARGAAGSGLVLDPARARGELEPYSRMAGGMLKDALDEADVHVGGRREQVVMIKCRACGKLNEEDSKFCQECGKPL